MKPTDAQVEALAEAMAQILDDMGGTGTCVCPAAKAQARIAYEPFRLALSKVRGRDVHCRMQLREAQRITAEASR